MPSCERDGKKRAAQGVLAVDNDGTHDVWEDDPGLPLDSPRTVAMAEMLRRAREVRDALLAEEVWLTSEQIAERSTDAFAERSPEEYTKRLRSERRLLGVRFRSQYLHPASQFLPGGELHPAMADVLKYLPHSDANWTAAFWWFQPTGFLFEHGTSSEIPARRPADVFLVDPHRVVAAAEHDFVRGDDGW